MGPRRPASRRGLLVLLGVLLVAANLRPAITSVPPLLEAIRLDLALSYAQVSLLTTIPVLCMGLFALLTPAVVGLLGRERGVLWGLGLIAIATFARVAGEWWAVLIASTVLVGIGIAVCQTLLPSIVNVHFPNRLAFTTGLYTAFIAIGATLGAGLTAPIDVGVGSWPVALGVWGLLALVALAAWGPATDPVRRGGQGAGVGWPILPRIPWRSGLAWLVTLFLGVVANFFYTGITWLPPRYMSLGWSESSAGLLLSVFVVAQLGGMLLVSALGDRSPDRRPLMLLFLAAVSVSTVAIAVAPLRFPWAMVALFGIGAGGLFTVALTLPADYTIAGPATDRLSSMVFAGGYMLAAVGPYAVGATLDRGVGYRPIFLGFAVFALVLALASLRLSPERGPVAVSLA